MHFLVYVCFGPCYHAADMSLTMLTIGSALAIASVCTLMCCLDLYAGVCNLCTCSTCMSDLYALYFCSMISQYKLCTRQEHRPANPASPLSTSIPLMPHVAASLPKVQDGT